MPLSAFLSRRGPIPHHLAAVAVALPLLLTSTLPAAAHPGWGMERLPDRRAAFTDIFQSTVWVVDPSRQDPIAERLIDMPVHVHQLALDPDGALLAEEHDYRDNAPFLALHRIDGSGRIETLAGPNRDHREVPWQIQDAAGSFYGPLHFRGDEPARLYRWSRDGTRGAALAGGGDGIRDGHGEEAGFSVIGSLAWGPDSTVLVGDYGAVRAVTRDGKVSTLAKGHPLLGPGNHPYFRDQVRPHLYGMRTLPDASVLVANYGMGVLLRLRPQGPPASDSWTGWRVDEVYRSKEPWAVVNALPLDGDGWLVLEAPSLHSHDLGGMRLLTVNAAGTAQVLLHTGD